MSRLYNYVICPNTTSFLCNSNLSVENVAVSAVLNGINVSPALYNTPSVDGGNRIYFATDSPGTYILNCNLVLRENSHILMSKFFQFPPLSISIPSISGVIIVGSDGTIITDGGTGGTGVKIKLDDIPDLRLPPEEDQLFEPVVPPEGGPNPGPGPGPGPGGMTQIRYIEPGDYRTNYVRVRRTYKNCLVSPTYEVNYVDANDVESPSGSNPQSGPSGVWGDVDSDCHSDMLVRVDNILDNSYNWSYANVDAVTQAAGSYASSVNTPITAAPSWCCDVLPCAVTGSGVLVSAGTPYTHLGSVLGYNPGCGTPYVYNSTGSPWATPFTVTPASTARPCNWIEMAFTKTFNSSATASGLGCGWSLSLGSTMTIVKNEGDSYATVTDGQYTFSGSYWGYILDIYARINKDPSTLGPGDTYVVNETITETYNLPRSKYRLRRSVQFAVAWRKFDNTTATINASITPSALYLEYVQ